MSAPGWMYTTSLVLGGIAAGLVILALYLQPRIGWAASGGVIAIALLLGSQGFRIRRWAQRMDSE